MGLGFLVSNIALRQILLENGTEKDKQEALKYEQGCILNSLHYGGMDGWIPIWIERNAPSREEMLKTRNPWKSNMHNLHWRNMPPLLSAI